MLEKAILLFGKSTTAPNVSRKGLPIMNILAKNNFKWVKSKLKKIPDYVSYEDEFLAQEKARDNERARQAQGSEDEGEHQGPDPSFLLSFDQGGSSSFHP